MGVDLFNFCVLDGYADFMVVPCLLRFEDFAADGVMQLMIYWCCRFHDLSSILEPGRSVKTEKPAILDDAIRVLTQLRTESQELRETNEKMLEEIKCLKVGIFSLFGICLLLTEFSGLTLHHRLVNLRSRTRLRFDKRLTDIETCSIHHLSS